MPSHVVLLGDSIFDNSAYTQGEPDVAAHLRDLLPPWRVTLCAVDGSATADLGPQFARLSADATHVVLSVGGNDALMNADLLNLPVRSTAEALDLFRGRVDAFEAAYRRAVENLVALGRETTLCTIYNGNLEGEEAKRARIALALFNDVILRTALRLGVNAIDLRLVCTEPEDYANPIEPSGTGGRKIAQAIARALGATTGPSRQSTMTAG